MQELKFSSNEMHQQASMEHQTSIAIPICGGKKIWGATFDWDGHALFPKYAPLDTDL